MAIPDPAHVQAILKLYQECDRLTVQASRAVEAQNAMAHRISLLDGEFSPLRRQWLEEQV